MKRLKSYIKFVEGCTFLDESFKEELLSYLEDALSDKETSWEYQRLQSEGRILPQGFSCVDSSDGKNLLIFHPKGRGITHDVSHEYGHSQEAEAALAAMKGGSDEQNA